MFATVSVTMLYIGMDLIHSTGEQQHGSGVVRNAYITKDHPVNKPVVKKGPASSFARGR